MLKDLGDSHDSLVVQTSYIRMSDAEIAKHGFSLAHDLLIFLLRQLPLSLGTLFFALKECSLLSVCLPQQFCT